MRQGGVELGDVTLRAGGLLTFRPSAFLRLPLGPGSRQTAGAGLAAGGGGRGHGLAGLGAVDGVAEGGQGRGRALGLALGTPGRQSWSRGTHTVSRSRPPRRPSKPLRGGITAYRSLISINYTNYHL